MSKDEKSNDDVLEVVGIIAGVVVGVLLLLLFFPIIFLALLICSIAIGIKKITWLTYASYLSLIIFSIAAYFAGLNELIQYIPVPFTFVGLDSFIEPLQTYLNNGKVFEMSGATYILILSLSFMVARFMVTIYQFVKGKVVKPKEDVIEHFRSSKEYQTIFKNRLMLNEKVQIKYRQKKEKEIKKSGYTTDVLLGIDEYGKSAHMSLKEANQHILLQGTTGSGKTITTYSLVETTLMNKESVLFIDGKGDPKTIKELQSLCDYYGRKLHVFSENTKLKYNPIRNGNRTSVTDRIMATFDWGSGDGMFYKNESENQLQKVIHFLDDYGISRDIKNVTTYLSVPRIYKVLKNDYETIEETIIEKVPIQKEKSNDDVLGIMTDENEKIEYEKQEKVIEKRQQTERSKRFMHYFFGKEMLSDKEEENVLEGEDETSKLFRGMQSQLEIMLYSELGDLLEESDDGIDLTEIIKKGESVVFSFNSLSYKEFMKRFARFVIADISNAVQQQFGEDNKKGVMGVFDEFGAYGSSTIVNIVARARSANFRAVIGIQSFGDLTIQGEDISQQVIDNTNTFFLGRSNSDKSPEAASNIMGTFGDVDITHQVEDKGTIFKRIDFKSEMGTSRKVKRFFVHPDQIKEFTIGEFAVLQKVVEERAIRRVIYFRNPLEGLEVSSKKRSVKKWPFSLRRNPL